MIIYLIIFNDNNNNINNNKNQFYIQHRTVKHQYPFQFFLSHKSINLFFHPMP